ncbi:unnamed protein product [Cylindrotheca closterium]|uniref:Uncharacterized protein n=1 Tax=Cylindrotheca closterium TaxID=2856 RepID=A0AAD2G952_9STRA|nr:unnamed protein product [Cylindrotheca closterium]
MSPGPNITTIPMILKAYLTEDDVEDDYPLTFAPKRAKILGGLPTSDDIEADNTFKPPTNFVPFVNNNGDHMLAVEMLLPSGYYNNKERYWVELDGDKIIVTIKMPRLLEDHINMFYAIVGEDEKLQGMMHSANKVSIAKHQKNAGGDILMTAEVDLPSTSGTPLFLLKFRSYILATILFFY